MTAAFVPQGTQSELLLFPGIPVGIPVPHSLLHPLLLPSLASIALFCSCIVTSAVPPCRQYPTDQQQQHKPIALTFTPPTAPFFFLFLFIFCPPLTLSYQQKKAYLSFSSLSALLFSFFAPSLPPHVVCLPCVLNCHQQTRATTPSTASYFRPTDSSTLTAHTHITQQKKRLIMPRMRRIALVCCFLSICLVFVVRLPSRNLLSGILEQDPHDAERIMMERYAHSLQFKGKVRIKSLTTALEDDRSDDIELLPKKLTRKERGTTVYFPPACKNGRHWQICKKIVPSFMIAGAEHSGADVLYEAFRTHPQVWDLVKSNEMYERTGNASMLEMPENQETPFFGSQSYNDLDPATKNLEWYLQYFPSIKDIPVTTHNPVLSGESVPHIQHYGLGHVNMEHQEQSQSNQKILVGECAPSYLHMNGASKRIASTMPEIKAVFIFRDPIDRAYLNYLEQKQYAAGYSFEEIVAEELLILKECIARPGSKKWTEFLKCHSEEATKTAKRMALPNRPRSSNARDPPAPLLNLIVKGLYYSQLHEFVKYVPFTKILVLRTEDLYNKKSTVSTMVRLSHFLNLDPAPFMNFPIEIGTDPMAPLRHGGAGYNKVFGSNGILVQDEEDLLTMNDDPELEYERRGPSGSTGSLPQQVFSDPPLELATRFRLQRVFEPFNQKLVDMFEHRQDFPGWEYDVDRG